MTTTSRPPESAPPAMSRTGALTAWFDPDEPHLPRGPFRRWPRTADGVLAVVVFAASLVAVALSALDDAQDLTFDAIQELPAGAVALLAIAATALWWRRAQPIAVTAVVLAVMTVWALAGYGDGQELALIVATYGVGRYTSDDRQALATVAVAIAVSIGGTVIDASQRVDIVPAILLSALPWYVGRRVRNRGDYLTLLRERTARLEAEQHAEARRAVADERSRIARELHDVVAHRVSMMTVQAGAAKTIAPHDLDAAIEAMGDVEGAGRQALGELRHLLGVLRPDASERDALVPQPGLSDVPALVDELTRTGAAVTLTIVESPDDLAAAVDLSAYRIVQESITNIIKHAGPDPTVELAITPEAARLVIDVTNTIDTTRPQLPASGFGIAGMRERAALLGGTLSAAPEPPGRYRVHAVLPLRPEPA